MASSIRSRSSAALLAAVIAWAPLASRAAPSSEQRARQLFSAAQAEYDLGRFEQALEGYSEAYRAKALPGFLFNLAQCHRQLAHWDQAAFFYRRYLELAPAKSHNTELAQTLLAEVQTRAEAAEDALRRQREADAAALRRPVSDPAKTDPRAAAFAAGPKAEGARVGGGPLAQSLTAPPAAAVSAQPPGLLSKWWFWAGVGVLAAGGATAAIVASSPRARPTSLGDVSVR